MQKLFEGKYLRVLDDDGWEFAQRTGVTGVVVILAVTDDDRVVLVEQYRKPVKARVLELPAGLAGDLLGAEDEELVTAAARELHEETGYEATEWTVLGEAPVSAGLSDETVMFFLARGLTKTGPGGGDDSEDIEVFEVPLADLRTFLKARQEYGTKVDAKIGGGLWLAEI
jgi:ADP-ribose pyrophosphatase